MEDAAPVRAVLLDFGGTLFSYTRFRERFDQLLVDTAARHGIDAPAADLRRSYGESIAHVVKDYSGRPFYLHRDLFGDCCAAFLGALGATADETARALFYEGHTEVARPLIEPREGAAETLRELAARNIHVGIVSNIDDDQFEVLWTRCGLAPHVHATTTSEQAGSCKPDPAIFHLALEKAGNPRPAEVLFVGDSVPNDIAGANAVGLRSVLLTRRPPADGPPRATYTIRGLPELLALVTS